MARILSSQESQGVFPKWPNYPWSQWLDGQTWELTQGVDFEVEPKQFQSGAYAAARKYGVKVRTTIVGDKIVMQAIRNGAT